MEILIKPIVTEKMTGQAEGLNRYGLLLIGMPLSWKLNKPLKACIMFQLNL